MTNHELTPQDQPDHIVGDYTTISITNVPMWHDLLAKETAKQYIDLGTNEDLPWPIHRANFHYEKEHDDPLPTITAELSMLPEHLPDEQQEDWQREIIDELKVRAEQAHALVTTLEHDRYSFYIQLPPHHIIRATTIADIDRCYVSVTLSDDHAYRKLLGDDFPIDTNEESEPTSNYIALLRTLGILAHAFDTCIDLYGEPSKNSHHELSLGLYPPADMPAEATSEHPAEATAELAEDAVRFSDIYGYDDIKTKLLDLSLIHTHPDVAASIGLESSGGILLYGEPGTGKTKLLTAFANEIGATFVPIAITDIVDKWVGTSAKNIDSFFERIIEIAGPVVVFMDEFDSIGSSNPHGTSERQDMVNILKQWVVKINENYHNVILTGATNNLEGVDKALVRPGRFSPMEVPIPNEQSRREIWHSLLAKVAFKSITLSMENTATPILDIASDINYDKLASASQGMVGAHFTQILNSIRLQRLREFAKVGHMSPITEAEILREINAYNLGD